MRGFILVVVLGIALWIFDAVAFNGRYCHVLWTEANYHAMQFKVEVQRLLNKAKL